MKKTDKFIDYRRKFRVLLLENPDYFGNMSKAGDAVKGFKPKVEIVSDTNFEELTCVSFNPETEELRAIVQVKQKTGYSGGPCTDGSKEYVRFYVDYNRDGSWIDEGVVNFDVHDLPFKQKLCYAVKLKIDPKKRRCCDDSPVLPRVRAILSWNDEPQENKPHWLPIWGNRLEANIQIAPQTGLVCLLKDKLAKLDIAIDSAKLEDLTKTIKIEGKPTSLPEATLLALKAQYGKKVEASRFGFKAIHDMTKKPNQPALSETVEMLEMSGVSIPDIVKFLQDAKFNTHYEEVKCVGLNRNFSILHAGILVKRPSGYSGDLCHKGSREYVAFYMDFGSGWEYMGTTSVSVHDIPQIPKDGIWYNAALPISLSKHQEAWCQTGIAKVRAILSWNVSPPSDDPDYTAYWGDWEECHVEIKPLPNGVQPDQIVPVIESLGGMPVTMINNNGYANGENAAGLRGIDSPFDGKILITGIIANAPDWSAAGVAQLQYRIMVRQPSQNIFQPSLRKFTIYKTRISNGIPSSQVPLVQTPDPEGWMEYYPDFFAPDIVTVDQNLMGVFVPAESGQHKLYVEIINPNPPPVIIQSNIVTFEVDKTVPEVDIEITSGAGNCGVFANGDIIEGTFSITAVHCYSVTLTVTPSAETHGAKPNLGGIPGPYELKYGSGLPSEGTNGIWKLDTGAMDPCGYNLRIRGEDRTIVNSRNFGREAWDIEGFCLE